MIAELLAPAGNLVKLKFAIEYGADAVYLGGGEFSLRNTEFENDAALKIAVEYAHSYGKKAYITANIFPHNRDLAPMAEYIKTIAALNADGIILSDLGVFSLAQKYAPNVPIHISTQANNLNHAALTKWHEMGASRIILARELTFSEIAEIRENVPETLELEAFVHGAMCVSYSGRCLLSNYLTARDANQGECAQPCRWKYNLFEENRPNQAFPIEETERGAFIFNSKDLCLARRLNELKGVNSLKIEGRNKSEYYVASVVKAYKMAQNGDVDGAWDEVHKTSHRAFMEGWGSKPSEIYETSSYIRSWNVVGIITNWQDGIAEIEQRNKIIAGSTLEILQPHNKNITITNAEIQDEHGNAIESTPHPQMKYFLKCKEKIEPMSFLRKKETD